jgi:hypothetical protein
VAAGKRSFRILANYFSLNRLEKRGFSKSESRACGLVDGMAPPIFNSNASR